jgi:hypothetical protein
MGRALRRLPAARVSQSTGRQRPEGYRNQTRGSLGGLRSALWNVRWAFTTKSRRARSSDFMPKRSRDLSHGDPMRRARRSASFRSVYSASFVSCGKNRSLLNASRKGRHDRKGGEGLVPNRIYHRGTELTKIEPLVETYPGFISKQPDAAREARCIVQVGLLCVLCVRAQGEMQEADLRTNQGDDFVPGFHGTRCENFGSTTQAGTGIIFM